MILVSLLTPEVNIRFFSCQMFVFLSQPVSDLICLPFSAGQVVDTHLLLAGCLAAAVTMATVAGRAAVAMVTVTGELDKFNICPPK